MLETASTLFLRIKVMKIRFYTLTYSDLIFNDNLCVCYQAFVQTGFNKSPAITGEGGKVQMRTEQGELTQDSVDLCVTSSYYT